jgi:hypothetical protein
VNVDCAEQAAVALAEIRGVKQGQPFCNGIEAIASVSKAAVTCSCLGVTVQADPDPDTKFLEDFEHGCV